MHLTAWVPVCVCVCSVWAVRSKEEALKEMEAMKDANRKMVDNLVAKAKLTSEENTKTRAEVESTAKASKEEVARLHAMISQQRRMVEEQKKMIARLTAKPAVAGGGAAARLPPSPATNDKKRSADAAKIPAPSPTAAGGGSAEKKARTLPPKPSPTAAGVAAAASPGNPVAAAGGGGGAPNPLLAFLTRKEKAGSLTPQQKEQLAAIRYVRSAIIGTIRYIANLSHCKQASKQASPNIHPYYKPLNLQHKSRRAHPSSNTSVTPRHVTSRQAHVCCCCYHRWLTSWAVPCVPVHNCVPLNVRRKAG
jgi:polyhydroxyalkanoate synthesis regulator phasin